MPDPVPQATPAAIAPEPAGRPPREPVSFNERWSGAGSLRVRAARGTLINTAFTVGAGLLGLLKGFILAGYLSRADYGIWGILVVSLTTLLWIKQAGIGDKYIQQDEMDQRLAFQKAFTLELALTGLCALLILAATPILVAMYGLPKLVLPCVVVAAVLMVSVLQSPLWVFYRRMEYGRQRALAAIDPVVGFVVSVAMAAAGLGYWAFVGGFAAGVCASSLVAVVASPFPLRLRYEPGTLRKYWSFSAPLVVAGAATFVMAWSAVIAAKVDLGVAAVGVITLAANVTSFAERVDELVTGTLYPAICAVKDQTTLLYESLIKSNRLALTWAVPCGVGLTLFGADLVHFGIGERWHQVIVVLQVYGLATAINHVGFNWTAYFRAVGQTRPIAVVTWLATAVFLVSGIPLLLTLGLPGFALGIAVQGLAALALRAWYLHRLFPAFDFLRHASRSFVPTIPATLIVLVARRVETGPRTVGMALGELAAFALVVAAITWPMERGLFREAIGYLAGRGGAPALT